MDKRVKVALGAVGGIVVLSAGAFFLLGNRPSDIPIIKEITAPATCPLSGSEPAKEAALDRPAVAVKIENAAIAYPLSGLEDAELVYEELVEGGVTRFMAVYHCTDSTKAGPVRSARVVDPAIMGAITRILAYSGQNAPVLRALEEAEVVRLDETEAGEGLQRIERSGISMEHTLYADTKILRKLGTKEFDDPPPGDTFTFGDIEGKTKPAKQIEINFNPVNTIRYDWSDDGWLRFEADEPFMAESGDQIIVNNVLIEEHEVIFSNTITDVAGNPSLEIANETGSGRAFLFRDGQVIKGKWSREDVGDAVTFETKEGDEFVFAPGSIWIELLPSKKGEVKGSFDFKKK
ncbi:MAG TPA: DUF3048 domain-containing protein [Actinomycetota bacterium]|nr:DUF3048 domain-containing protein [Actinomycetota bacterium]